MTKWNESPGNWNPASILEKWRRGRRGFISHVLQKYKINVFSSVSTFFQKKRKSLAFHLQFSNWKSSPTFSFLYKRGRKIKNKTFFFESSYTLRVFPIKENGSKKSKRERDTLPRDASIMQTCINFIYFLWIWFKRYRFPMKIWTTNEFLCSLFSC